MLSKFSDVKSRGSPKEKKTNVSKYLYSWILSNSPTPFPNPLHFSQFKSILFLQLFEILLVLKYCKNPIKINLFSIFAAVYFTITATGKGIVWQGRKNQSFVATTMQRLFFEIQKRGLLRGTLRTRYSLWTTDFRLSAHQNLTPL